MMYKFGRKSIDKLLTCHGDIQLIMNEAIKESPFDFGITHGHRTPEEQNKLYKKGRELPGEIVTYMDGFIKKSKHNYFPALACDIIIYKNDGNYTWECEYYQKVADHILYVSEILFRDDKISNQLVWGGNWKRFKDLPHFQI